MKNGWVARATCATASTPPPSFPRSYYTTSMNKKPIFKFNRSGNNQTATIRVYTYIGEQRIGGGVVVFLCGRIYRECFLFYVRAVLHFLINLRQKTYVSGEFCTTAPYTRSTRTRNMQKSFNKFFHLIEFIESRLGWFERWHARSLVFDQ